MAGERLRKGLHGTLAGLLYVVIGQSACEPGFTPDDIVQRDFSPVQVSRREQELGWLEIMDSSGSIQRLMFSEGQILEETAGSLLPVHPLSVRAGDSVYLWTANPGGEGWLMLIKVSPPLNAADDSAPDGKRPSVR